MEKHIQIFLRKLSYLSITIATLTLILTYLLQTPPQTCINPNLHPHHKPHPKSTCEAAHRPTTTAEKKNHRLWSTNAWRKSVDSFSNVFTYLQSTNHLKNTSHVLVVSAGGGHAVASLNQIGVHDVTGVEVIDSPPLVAKSDPHNLPFFDGVFDLGFSACLDLALFPSRYVRELERTVRVGGRCVVCVEECGDGEVKEVMKLFARSELSESRNVTVSGSRMTMIVARRIKARS
ncbi:hypothetical protein OSB04_014217 [Centaurea solstitialis]|uniref:Methyltransferase type 11 domain-containing protein n=1 Tax=Centaurea solstitialis TaxID=347529 RepID=A0AA38W7V7_9ASTR|nr:hypothetical protein OSB04_014217 [Centaurea solstitialis]